MTGAVLWSYAAVVMVGSVHLAWHYALDGYVAAVLTWLLWRGVGWLTVRRGAPAVRPPS
jgi:hypothetical protein